MTIWDLVGVVLLASILVVTVSMVREMRRIRKRPNSFASLVIDINGKLSVDWDEAFGPLLKELKAMNSRVAVLERRSDDGK